MDEEGEQQVEGQWSRTTWPGEATVARDLIAGEQSSVVVYLLNLGVQIVNILTELYALCKGILVLEI